MGVFSPAGAKEVPGRSGLRVTKEGDAWAWNPRRQQWIILKPFPKKTGSDGHMLYVRYVEEGVCRVHSLARLVLSTWVEPRPFGFRAFHFPDSDRRNCRADNLRWVPHGLTHYGTTHPSNRGENHPNSIVNDRAIGVIKLLINEGFTNTEIARLYEIRPDHVGAIRHGKRASHIAEAASLKPTR